MSIDLSTPGLCDDTDLHGPVDTPMQATIIHKPLQAEVLAYRCQVTITRTIHRCGYDSLHYGSSTIHINKNIPVLPKECHLAFSTHQLGWNNVVYMVKEGIHTFNYYTHGKRDESDTCIKEAWHEEGRMWYKSYAEEWATVTLVKIQGDFDTETGNVEFEDVVVPEAKEFFMDQRLGTVVWNTSQAGCHQTFTRAYEGATTLTFERASLKYSTPYLHIPDYIPEKAVVSVKNAKSQQYASFIIRQKVQECGTVCYSTHLRGFHVCPFIKGRPQKMKTTKTPLDVNTLLINLDTQLSNLHLQFISSTKKAFRLARTQICNVERKTLYNKLQAIANGNPYALLNIHGPGYRVTRSGGIAYITKCAPVQAIFVKEKNCTQEIPAYIANEHLNATQKVYVDALTRIIVPVPTILPCDPLFPPAAFINGTWKTLGEPIDIQKRPTKLAPTQTEFWQSNLTFHVGKGVFSEEQLLAHRTYMTTLTGRNPRISLDTYNEIKDKVNTKDYTVQLSPSYAMDRFHDAWNAKFFPWVDIFGDTWHLFLAIIILLTMLKTTLNVLLRLVYTYKREGCSLTMVFALWDALWVVMKSPIALTDAATRSLVGARPRTNMSDPLDAQQRDETTSFIENKSRAWKDRTFKVNLKQSREDILNQIEDGLNKAKADDSTNKTPKNTEEKTTGATGGEYPRLNNQTTNTTNTDQRPNPQGGASVPPPAP